ncbi:MAG: FkbM family methyltransferase [Lachnospiraceae bacterium]|nr:FkbM family methyltransferase [Lachnospiraceae bacterium]
MSREKLCSFLKKDIPQIEGKKLWIFGAGNTSVLYYNGLMRLEKEGFYIEGYVDNDSTKWGQTFNGKTVVSLDSLENRKNEICILICSIQAKVIKALSEQLDQKGYLFYLIDDVILKLHFQQVMSVYDSFEDDKSRDLYEDLIYERISGAGRLFETDCREQYFALPHFEMNNPNEVFVDCGAYVGDTLERYIFKKEGVFRKIICFEPDPHNYQAMEERIQRLKLEWGLDDDKIQIHNEGVSDIARNVAVERYGKNNGLGSHVVIGSDNDSGRVVSLDDAISERYTFLKADIESFEYNMLLGAKKGIQNNKPLLAICIYHNVVDFYEIPKLIKEFDLNYKLSIRQHSPVLSDTVLYAWID